MNASVRLVLACVAAGLAVGSAPGQARMTSTAGPVVVSPYWGYAARPYSFMSGVADVIQAQGEFLVNDQQAKLMREKVRQEKLVTRRKTWEQWRWETDFLHGMRLRQRQIGKEQDLIAALDASDGRIYSGGALNDLLKALWENKDKLSEGGSVRIPAGVLERVNFTTPEHKGCSTGLLKGEELRWPFLLQLGPFNDLRQQADRQYTQMRRDARMTGTVRAQDVVDLMETLATLEQQCVATSRDGQMPGHYTGSDFIGARRYVKELHSAAGVIKRDPRAAGIATVKADNVAALVGQMRGQDFLLFAPAVQGDERYYCQLHAALAEEIRRSKIEPSAAPSTAP